MLSNSCACANMCSDFHDSWWWINKINNKQVSLKRVIDTKSELKTNKLLVFVILRMETHNPCNCLLKIFTNSMKTHYLNIICLKSDKCILKNLQEFSGNSHRVLPERCCRVMSLNVSMHEHCLSCLWFGHVWMPARMSMSACLYLIQCLITWKKYGHAWQLACWQERTLLVTQMQKQWSITAATVKIKIREMYFFGVVQMGLLLFLVRPHFERKLTLLEFLK